VGGNCWFLLLFRQLDDDNKTALNAQREITSAKRENTGVWGRRPQRGPGAEPLVLSVSVGHVRRYCVVEYDDRSIGIVVVSLVSDAIRMLM